jgi:23S rRNA pseudouridine2604 synthase
MKRRKPMRINKLLSNYGCCSRKEANRLLEAGRIEINGLPGIPGQWVEEEDHILLDGLPLKPQEKIYLVYHKPPGVVCTLSPMARDNLLLNLSLPEYVFPVGRLDKDSRGLLLLTNDGDWAHGLLSDEHHVEKEYAVTVDGPLTESFARSMGEGVDILGTRTRPCRVSLTRTHTFSITLTQGLNRQIRRMAYALGYTVTDLQRVRMADILLGDLPEGEYRSLSKEELHLVP